MTAGQNKLKTCEKMIRTEAFQKAIESEVPPETTIDVSSVVVDSSYTGPHLQYDSNNQPIYTLDFARQCMDYMKDQKSIHRKYVIQTLLAAIRYFQTLPTLLEVSLPRRSSSGASSTGAGGSAEICGNFTVCGDTHGQYYDLLNIFKLGGFPSEENFYLFNGDYVDRGSFSFENVFALLLIKLALPQGFHMLRGNHETK